MIEPQPERKTKPFAERLSGIGRTSRLVLIIGIFAIVFIGLYIIGAQQEPQQAELRLNIATLQRGLSTGTQVEPRDKLQAQIRQTEAENEAARAIFPTPDQLTEIMDKLLKLARDYDLDVTGTTAVLVQKKLNIGAIEVPYDVFTVQLSLQGMVPNFQNFLLALGDVLPTAQVNQINFTVPIEDDEPDMATIGLDVYCLKDT